MQSSCNTGLFICNEFVQYFLLVFMQFLVQSNGQMRRKIITTMKSDVKPFSDQFPRPHDPRPEQRNRPHGAKPHRVQLKLNKK